MSEVVGIYCLIVECVDTATSQCKTVGLRTDLSEATFTETVRTDLSVVEGEFAASAGVDFPLWEHAVEGEKDDEGDADS